MLRAGRGVLMADGRPRTGSPTSTSPARPGWSTSPARTSPPATRDRVRPGAGLRRRSSRCCAARACPRATPSRWPGSPGSWAPSRRPTLIPLCHPLAISGVTVDLAVADDAVEITATVRTTDRTGVEMEALTAVVGRRAHRRSTWSRRSTRARSSPTSGSRPSPAASRGDWRASRREPAAAAVVVAVEPRRGRGLRRRDRAADRRRPARAGLRRSATPVVVPDGEPGRRRRSRAAVDGRRPRRAHHRRHRPHPDRPHPRGRPARCSTARCPASPRRSGRTASRKGVPTAVLSRGLAGVVGRLPRGQPPRLARRGEGRARGARAAAACTPSSRSSGATIEPRGGRSRLRRRRGRRCGRWRTRDARRLARGPARATPPGCGRGTPRSRPAATARPATFRPLVRRLHRQARQGAAMPFAIEVDGRFAGQVTVNNIVRGSAQFASVGYWLDREYAGRGVMPRAVAMVIDHCFFAGRAAPDRDRDPPGELQLAAGGGEARASARSATRRGSCTSTAPGATTGSSRSPSRSAPAGCSRRPRIPTVTRVISATHLWTSAPRCA